MNKSWVHSFIFLLFVSFASAQYYGGGSSGDVASGLEYGMNQIIWIVESLLGPFFYALLGGGDGFLFERVLLAVVILSFVYAVVSRIETFRKNSWVVWIITIAVTLLSTRFLMGSELIMMAILPYTVLGVTISAIVPLIIYFFFVKEIKTSVMRKILWIFYVVIYLGIWMSRYEDIGKLSWAYFIAAMVALIFLLFDGTLRRIMINNQMKELNYDTREKFAMEVRKQLKELNKNHSDGLVGDAYYNRASRRLKRQLESIIKN